MILIRLIKYLSFNSDKGLSSSATGKWFLQTFVFGFASFLQLNKAKKVKLTWNLASLIKENFLFGCNYTVTQLKCFIARTMWCRDRSSYVMIINIIWTWESNNIIYKVLILSNYAYLITGIHYLLNEWIDACFDKLFLVL